MANDFNKCKIVNRSIYLYWLPLRGFGGKRKQKRSFPILYTLKIKAFIIN